MYSDTFLDFLAMKILEMGNIHAAFIRILYLIVVMVI